MRTVTKGGRPGLAIAPIADPALPEARLAYRCTTAGRYHRRNMHLGDSIFIFILALVLFGPKKLPEMARQIGKLMAEFRRASNDFRLQIDEELRTMERQEQQKKQEAERTALASGTAEPSILPPAVAGDLAAGGSVPATNETPAPNPLQVLPPQIGEQVSAGTPYAISAPDPAAVDFAEPEDHPLLRVETIPVDPHANGSQPTGLAAAEANAAALRHDPEAEQATLQNG